MRLQDMKIRTKLTAGFLAAVVIFLCVGVYQIRNLRILSTLQNAGTQRAANALSVKEINMNVDASYAVFANAIVNTDIERIKREYADASRQAQRDIETLLAIVDTDREKGLARTFEDASKKYLGTFERELLPLLGRRDNALRRADDALTIADIQQKVASVYQIANDAILNRDLEGAKAAFASVKGDAARLLKDTERMIDTDEERMRMEMFALEYNRYLDIMDRRLFPALAAGQVSEATLREIDDELDIARSKVMAQIEGIVASLREKMQLSAAQEKRILETATVLAALRAQCIGPIAEIGRLLVEKNAAGDKQFDAVAAQTIGWTIAVCIAGLLLSLAIAFFIVQMITRPVGQAVALCEAAALGDLDAKSEIEQKDEIGTLVASITTMNAKLRELVQAAERISAGDLTVTIEPRSDKDALGHALRRMTEYLSQIVREIANAANNIAAGAAELSATSQAMSQGATEQASSLEEISSSMNEIAAQTKKNAENASQANKLAGEAKAYAAKGNEQMQQMVAAMKEINQSSRNISKIIKVIDEIAFQTNLLALNAAVEAARAGRHGKGFAVVAEEVRGLAARSAKAARETTAMIEDSMKKAEVGTGIADRTAAALQEIVAGVGTVTDLVAEIAAASNEQAQGVSQITQGLGQIDQVTQQNTAHAEESASAAEELSSQAMVLQQLVATFKLETSGYSETPALHAGSTGDDGRTDGIAEPAEQLFDYNEHAASDKKP